MGAGRRGRATRRRSSRAIAYRKHVRLARLEGGALGIGGIFTAAPDVVALIWIQSRMVFYIAAAYGYDPRHPMRPAELLALQGVYATPAEARKALDGIGKLMAQAMVEKALAVAHHAIGLHRRLVKYVAKRMARRYAGRCIPFIGAPIGAVQNGGATKALGRDARWPTTRARRRARRRRVVGAGLVRDEEAHDLRDLLRLDPLGVVGVRLRLAVGGRVDHARQDRVAADAVALVLGVERLDQREHRRLGGDVRRRRRGRAAAPRAPRPRRTRPRRARSAAASPRARAGSPA